MCVLAKKRLKTHFYHRQIPRHMLQLGCESLLERASSQGKNCCLNGNDPTILLTDILTISTPWMLCKLANIYTRA